MRGPRALWIVALLLVGSLLAGSAAAQTSHGAIRGEVVDAEGTPLPGVQIELRSPALIQPRTLTTGTNGEFSAPGLPVGSYTVAASISGFEPTQLDDVRVSLGATAAVRMTLQLEGVSAQVVVTIDDTTITDPTDTGTGGRVTYDELLKVPTARDPWAVLGLVPGIQSDRVNVGGTQSGQQANFVGKGDDGTNTVWSIDGVNITDPAATGSSASYYDFGSIEEIDVNTGGNDVTQLTGGVGINIVTKRGSNVLSGSARFTFTNDDFQWNNISSDIENASGDPANPFTSPKVHQILEFGGDVGGPIIKDRLWFWGSASRNKIEQRTITGDPDDTTLTNFAGKLSAQVLENNEANVFFNHNNKGKEGRDAAPDRPPNTTFNQETPTPLFKIEDQHIFGSDTLLQAKYAHVGGYFSLNPQGGSLETGNPNAPMAAYDDLTGNWDDKNFYTYYSKSSQDQFHLDASHFRSLGSSDHDFKFGFSYRHTPVRSQTYWDGGGYVNYNLLESGTSSDFDTNVVVYADETFSFIAKTISAYFSDTITTGQLTADVGLRFDRQTSRNTESERKENPLAPDVFTDFRFEGDDENTIEWTDVSPRVGLSYQVGQSVLLKANYAYYADQLPGRLALYSNPIPGYQYFYSYFEDSNGDRQASADEMVPLEGYPCGGLCVYVTGFDPENPDVSVNDVDPDLGSPKTHEAVVGITYQPSSSMTFGLDLTARNRGDVVWTVPLVVEADGTRRPLRFDDWVELPPDPEYQGDGAPEGDFDGNFALGPYTVNAFTLQEGLSLDNGAVRLTNRPDYHQRYLSAELMFQNKFGSRGILTASLSLSDWTEHFTIGGAGDVEPNRTTSNPGVDGGPVAPQSRGSGSFGEVFVNATWQSNVRGSYTIPKIEMDVGASLLVREGYPSPFVHRGFTGIPGDTSGSTNFLVGKLDDFRMDSLFNLDLHIGKELGITQKTAVELGLDLFNVFNSGTLLQHRLVANRDNFLQPTEILGPRLLRLSARFRF